MLPIWNFSLCRVLVLDGSGCYGGLQGPGVPTAIGMVQIPISLIVFQQRNKNNTFNGESNITGVSY